MRTSRTNRTRASRPPRVHPPAAPQHAVDWVVEQITTAQPMGTALVGPPAGRGPQQVAAGRHRPGLGHQTSSGRSTLPRAKTRGMQLQSLISAACNGRRHRRCHRAGHVGGAQADTLHPPEALSLATRAGVLGASTNDRYAAGEPGPGTSWNPARQQHATLTGCGTWRCGTCCRGQTSRSASRDPNVSRGRGAPAERWPRPLGHGQRHATIVAGEIAAAIRAAGRARPADPITGRDELP